MGYMMGDIQPDDCGHDHYEGMTLEQREFMGKVDLVYTKFLHLFGQIVDNMDEPILEDMEKVLDKFMDNLLNPDHGIPEVILNSSVLKED